MEYTRETDEKLVSAAYRHIERCMEAEKILADEHINYKLLSEDDEDNELWLSDFLTTQDFDMLQGIIGTILEREIAKCEVVIRTASMRLGRLPVFPRGYKAVS